MSLSATPEAIRQRKFKAAKKAEGLSREEYFATPAEHEALKKCLAGLRTNS